MGKNSAFQICWISPYLFIYFIFLWLYFVGICQNENWLFKLQSFLWVGVSLQCKGQWPNVGCWLSWRVCKTRSFFSEGPTNKWSLTCTHGLWSCHCFEGVHMQDFVLNPLILLLATVFYLYVFTHSVDSGYWVAEYMKLQYMKYV